MFDRIRFTWRAMGSSWDVLKHNKKLLWFPVFSGLACLLVLISFAVPIYFADAWAPPTQDAPPAKHALYYGTLFLFYFCNYFVITFFNSAVVGAAVQSLCGQRPTFGMAMRSATMRLPQILGWALISATVGLILRAIEDRSEKIGQFVVGLLGAAWTITTFLVVPVLVVEGKGPIESFEKSASLLKKTWGEQLMSNFGFGIIFFLLFLPAILIVWGGFHFGGETGGIIAIVAAALYVITLALIQSTLQSIFQAVLYLYAERGQTPEEFDPGLLSGAMAKQYDRDAERYMTENPYRAPRTVTQPAEDRRPNGRQLAARESAQADVSSLLARGVVFSIIWLLGFGSAYSIYLAHQAHRIIRRFNGELRGMIRVCWCYAVGGLGVAVVSSIVVVALIKRYA